MNPKSDIESFDNLIFQDEEDTTHQSSRLLIDEAYTDARLTRALLPAPSEEQMRYGSASGDLMTLINNFNHSATEAEMHQAGFGVISEKSQTTESTNAIHNRDLETDPGNLVIPHVVFFDSTDKQGDGQSPSTPEKQTPAKNDAQSGKHAPAETDNGTEKDAESSRERREGQAQRKTENDLLVEQSAKDVEQAIKSGTFGDWRSREKVQDIMERLIAVDGDKSGLLKQFTDKVNKDLAASGSDLRLDLVSEQSMKVRNSYEQWNERFRNLHLVLTSKDAPKHDLLHGKEYFDAAKDKITLKFQEMKDLPKDANEVYTIVNKIKELSEPGLSAEAQKNTWDWVKTFFNSANQFLNPEVTKELVDEVNSRLKKDGSPMRLTYAETSDDLHPPGPGMSGDGIRKMTVGLADSSGKQTQSFKLEQMYTWGAPILPGPPLRIPGIGDFDDSPLDRLKLHGASSKSSEAMPEHYRTYEPAKLIRKE
jgi:hypothetical protein